MDYDVGIVKQRRIISPSNSYFSVSSAVANNTALDGSSNGNNGGTGNVVLSITTVNTNDIIIVFAEMNGSFNAPTVAGGGLTWNSRSSSPPGSGIWEYYAKAASTLSGASITITPGAGGTYLECTIFGVSGANFTSPFDTLTANSGLPYQTASSPVSVTTDNAADFIYAGSRNSSNVGGQAGFTQISTGSFLYVQYKTYISTQTALSIQDSSGTTNGMIGDAIVSS